MKRTFGQMNCLTKLSTALVAGLILWNFPAGISVTWAQSNHLTELRELEHDTSPPLEKIPPLPPQAGAPRVVPLYRTHGIFARPQAQTDPVLQSSPSGALTPSSGGNFSGLGKGFSGPQGSFTVQYIPPDTNGAVGTTQYVQWVNASFAVFNKSTGESTYGPAAGNTLWTGFGGPCETNNSGDPIVQYDKLANRWVLMQPVFKAPYYICVAVSTTSDANGSYDRYAFPVPNRLFPDYPKLGVWSDGYYLTYNQFKGNIFKGAAACVLDRNNMLLGNAATMQCGTIGSNYGSLLPADLDGGTPPPAGSPGYFLNYNSNLASLSLWNLSVNWNNPNNSSLTGPTNLLVAAFSEACGGGACIPQAGTSQKLDSLGERLMYRLAYRNFGDHESMVVSHSVDTGTGSGNTGTRWYELRKTGGGSFGLFQQGTYAPDSDYRWMGSIAMDKFGNIGLGYSVSSSTTSPTIRYTGRLPTDPPGSMQAENDLLTGIGHGSQTSYARWGDYSSMTIDPVDDCTFWFTTEYQSVNGNAWSTRIASFRFPSCGGAVAISSVSLNPTSVVGGSSSTGTVTLSGAPAADTVISLSSSNASVAQVPSSVTVAAGATSADFNVTTSPVTTTTGVNITASYGSSTPSATLTVTPPLTASSVSLNPTSVVGGNSSTGTVTLSGLAPAGGANVTLSSSNTSVAQVPSSVTVASGATSATFNVTTSTVATTTGVNITANYGGTSPSATLTVNPVPAGDFSISVSPGNRTVKAGNSASYSITVTSTGGYAGRVNLDVSGLPNNASASVSPTSITNGSGVASLTVSTTSTTSKGSYTLTIKGIDSTGSPSHSTTTGLKVR